MAVVVIIEFPGGTEEMYEAVNAQLGVPDEWIPDGLIAHSAGPIDDGFRVIDIWRSAEDFESQIPPKIIPKIAEFAEAAGVAAPEPEISIEPLVDVFSQESEAVLA